MQSFPSSSGVRFLDCVKKVAETIAAVARTFAKECDGFSELTEAGTNTAVIGGDGDCGGAFFAVELGEDGGGFLGSNPCCGVYGNEMVAVDGDVGKVDAVGVLWEAWLGTGVS